MSAIPIMLTLAGFAALVNPAATGTAAVSVTALGITDQPFLPSPTLTGLPGEIKRLTTVGGLQVAPDTIHVTATDASTDTWTLRGLALYLADGTLFGVYGQGDAIFEKSGLATALLAIDIVFTGLDAAVVQFGPTSWANPPATTTVQGVLRLATDADAIAGEAPDAAVSPAALAAALAAFHPQWAELLGVPDEFPPAPHRQDWSTIDDPPATYPPSPHRQDWSTIDDVPASFPPAPHHQDWATIDNPPAAFPAAPHRQDWSTIDDVPASFPPAPHHQDWATIDNTPAQYPPAPHRQDWSTIDNKPSTFPPADHTNEWSDIDGKPATFPPDPHRQDWSTIDGVPATFPPAPHHQDWSTIDGKPATFPPAPHRQDWSTIDNPPATYPPSAHRQDWSTIDGVPTTFPPAPHHQDWSTIDGKPAVFPPAPHRQDWSTIDNPPATYPPSAHQHPIADVQGLAAALAALTPHGVDGLAGWRWDPRDGWLEQWGELDITLSQEGVFTIQFPVLFTTVMGASAIVLDPGSNADNTTVQRGAMTTSSVSLRIQDNVGGSGAAAAGFTWRVWGKSNGLPAANPAYSAAPAATSSTPPASTPSGSTSGASSSGTSAPGASAGAQQ